MENNIKLTFQGNNDSELLITIGNNISINVYEGKTASFTHTDIIKMLNIITNIIKEY